MSKRLQVLIPEELESALHKAARRERISKGEWVRRAIELVLRRQRDRAGGGAVDRLASLGAPTSDLEQMLAEIDAGRQPRDA